MALDIAKLENVSRKPNGKIIARCPACAAEGNDSKGEHLAVFSDGRFGCVVNPKDKSHTKEIFKLVGMKEARAEAGAIQARPFDVRCVVVSPSSTILILDRFKIDRIDQQKPTSPEALPVDEPEVAPAVHARGADKEDSCSTQQPMRLGWHRWCERYIKP